MIRFTLFLAALLFSVHEAAAFSVDDKAGMSLDVTSNYADPDEQPLPFGLGLNFGNSESGSTSDQPASTRQNLNGQDPLRSDWFTTTTRGR